MVLVNYGPDEGKLAVILDVADNNKVSASCLCFVYVDVFFFVMGNFFLWGNYLSFSAWAVQHSSNGLGQRTRPG